MLGESGRDYRLFVPDSYAHNSPAPLVIGLHGAGDSGANFCAGTGALGRTQIASNAGFILMVPDTKSPYDDFAVWSGNPQNDVPQMVGEMQELLDIRDEVAVHYNLDSEELHGFGFSDGGLFLAAFGMAFSDRFASLTIMGYGWGAG